MSDPVNVQFFHQSGVWHKPPRAVLVDIILIGGGGGASDTADGENAQYKVETVNASDLGSEVKVEIGAGGRPGGTSGCALIITHLAATPRHVHAPPVAASGTDFPPVPQYGIIGLPVAG